MAKLKKFHCTLAAKDFPLILFNLNSSNLIREAFSAPSLIMNMDVIVHPYPARFITGFRGARYLPDPDYYIYTFNKNLANSTKRYLCRQTERENCLSFAKVKDGMVVSLTEHTHPPASPAEIAVMIEKQSILDSILTNPEAPTQLVAQVMDAELQPEEQALVGHKESFVRSIQRKKAAILWKSKNSVNRAQLDPLRHTHRGIAHSERFLLSSFTDYIQDLGQDSPSSTITVFSTVEFLIGKVPVKD